MLTFSLLIITGFVACGNSRGAIFEGSEATQKPSEADLVTISQDAKRQDQVQILASALFTQQDEERLKAEQELIVLAQESKEQRQRVIQGLLEDVDRRNLLDGRHGVLFENEFPYWLSVTDIFAKLRATEALDILIKCIYCGNGYAGSLRRQPAFDALLVMGTSAVPKLSEALLNNPDEYAREQIALCLGTIGGKQAERALKHALRTETNKEVLQHIKIGLQTIDSDR